MDANFQPDAIIIGHGLAGLVAAYEVTRTGKKVLIVDQETEANLGGQAYWSFGGLFFISSPQQRRMGIKPAVIEKMKFSPYDALSEKFFLNKTDVHDFTPFP